MVHAAYLRALDTGAGECRFTTESASEPRFWFTIDIAIAREIGVALRGPPPAELFPELPPAEVLAAIEESLDWYAREESPEQLALARRRARRFMETGVFGPKRVSG